ncbi:STAS domain-containing protein [uncultured Agrobacterium sp.]|uniref:STAS domain-containing protein n=1 Tax=uncultured Agrobacterium sp. TaxID=157277 RepID=UPI0025D07842|nr:STAS domain-containing protein [uncultured Agrobacterium sp.]
MTPETVTLPSSLSIRGINAIHETLLSAFQEKSAIVLDIPEDATVDLSFVQLVESSRLYAREQGKFITLKKPATQGVVETLERAGFLENMDEASRLFWLHGKDI